MKGCSPWFKGLLHTVQKQFLIKTNYTIFFISWFTVHAFNIVQTGHEKIGTKSKNFVATFFSFFLPHFIDRECFPCLLFITNKKSNRKYVLGKRYLQQNFAKILTKIWFQQGALPSLCVSIKMFQN